MRSKAKVWANRCHGPLCRLSSHGDVGAGDEFLCGALWGNGIATVAPETWPDTMLGLIGVELGLGQDANLQDFERLRGMKRIFKMFMACRLVCE